MCIRSTNCHTTRENTERKAVGGKLLEKETLSRDYRPVPTEHLIVRRSGCAHNGELLDFEISDDIRAADKHLLSCLTDEINFFGIAIRDDNLMQYAKKVDEDVADICRKNH